MSKYTKIKAVKYCYHGCPFFDNSGHEMQCLHPIFEDKTKYKSVYDRMIITQQNSRDTVPEKCPLRTESTTEVVTIVRLEE